MTWSTDGISRPLAAMSIARRMLGIDLNLKGNKQLIEGKTGRYTYRNSSDVVFALTANVTETPLVRVVPLMASIKDSD